MNSAYHSLLFSIEKGSYSEVTDLLASNDLTKFADSLREKEIYDILSNAVVKKDTAIVSLLFSKFPETNFTLTFGPPLLFKAVLSGHEETVKLLLDKGAEVQVRCTEKLGLPWYFRGHSINKLTALHLAAREGFLNIVELLLNRGADINSTDSLKEIPLHASVKHPSIVAYLLSKGAQNDFLNNKEQSPLHTAASSECFESVKILVQNGAKATLKDKDQRTPLHYAAAKNNQEIVKYLLDQGAPINDQDVEGETSLHRAVSVGSSEIVKFLINNGAHVEAKNTKRKRPLHLAAVKEETACIEILLNAGVKVHVKDDQEETPLILALKCKNYKAVKLLVEKKKIINEQYGKSLLKIAAQKAPEVVEYLMKKGIGAETSSESEQTTLYYAAIEGNLVAVEALLENGAKLRTESVQRDIAEISEKSTADILKLMLDLYPNVSFDTVDGLDGPAPFHFNLVQNLENAVLLIKRGADVQERFRCRDSFPLGTALMHAIEKENYEIAESMLPLGADINDVTMWEKSEMTPLYQALSMPKCKPVVWCLQHGANVNILPANWGKKKFTASKYHASVKKLIKHLAYMRHKQLEVNEKLTELVNSHVYYVAFEKQCDKEIVGLLQDKFTGSITLYDVAFATSDRLASYARNASFAGGLSNKRDYEVKYRIYGSDVTAQAKKGIERRKMLDRAIQYGHILFPGLPQVITDMILNYLSEYDLQNLNEVLN